MSQHKTQDSDGLAFFDTTFSYPKPDRLLEIVMEEIQVLVEIYLINYF